MRRVRRTNHLRLLLRPLHRLNPLLLTQSLRSRRINLRLRLRLARHSIRSQLTRLTMHRLNVPAPGPQARFSIVQDLARDLGVLVRSALLAGHDGRVVQQVDEAAGLGCEEDLLLGALDDGGGVQVVGFFEFLAGDVGELRFGD